MVHGSYFDIYTIHKLLRLPYIQCKDLEGGHIQVLKLLYVIGSEKRDHFAEFIKIALLV